MIMCVCIALRNKNKSTPPLPTYIDRRAKHYRDIMRYELLLNLYIGTIKSDNFFDRSIFIDEVGLGLEDSWMFFIILS